MTSTDGAAPSATDSADAAKSSSKSHFLPHVQGLRAIAVMLVVLFHMWPGRIQGGYIGVDVFFVISGFLITNHLVREMDRSDRISLPKFYARRARRLLPAAILVLVVSIVLLFVFLPLSSVPENVKEILSSTFYVENWSLAFNSVDYLAQSNDASLVEHYWSLSVEEQFYLVWPWLIILGAWIATKYAKNRWRVVLVLLIALTAATYAFSIVYTFTNPAPAYFVTSTRMWEFGVGGLLAFLMSKWRPKAVMSNVLGYGGVFIVLVCGYFFTAQTVFPGWIAMVPVLGTAMVILAHHREHALDAGRILSLRPMEFVGNISYSIYLWHWPLIIVAPFVPFWGLSFVHRVGLLVMTFVLAWLTKKFVEDPGRTWKYLLDRKPRVTFRFALLLMAISTLAVLAVWAVRGPQYNTESQLLAQTLEHPPECFGAASGRSTGTGVTDDPCNNPQLKDVIIPDPGFGNADGPDEPDCLTTLNDSTLNVCKFGSKDPAAPKVALIGDSHSYALIDAFAKMADDHGWQLETYLKGGCSWSTAPLGGRGNFVESCLAWRKNLEGKLATDSKEFGAILTAAKYDHTLTSKQQSDGFIEAWQPTLDQGVPIVTIVDNPKWEDDPNKCLRTQPEANCTIAESEALPKVDPFRTAAEFFDSEGKPVTLLDFTPTYCVDGKCLSVIGGADVYRDPDHITRTFAFTLNQFIEPSISRAINSR